jgi:hypothetical protein
MIHGLFLAGFIGLDLAEYTMVEGGDMVILEAIPCGMKVFSHWN